MSVSGGVSYVPLLEPIVVEQGGLQAYALNDLADTEPLYTGKAKQDGTWLVQKFTTGSNMAYANLSNNPSVTSYADAWASRASLVYGTFQSLTGV